MKNHSVSTLFLFIFYCISWFTPLPVCKAATIPDDVILARQEKQTLVRGNGSEVAGLDPQKVEGTPESAVLRDLLEGLLITGPGGQLVAGVAKSWESADSKLWIFYLRKDARWSNGDPVTAHDFVYSFRRLISPQTGSPYINYLQEAQIKNIKNIFENKLPVEDLGVKALDDHTLSIELEEPLSYFDKMLTQSCLLPVHQKTVETYKNSWTQPKNWVGNGAYKIKEWRINEKLVLERNSEYWNNKNTVIETVTFLPIQSEGSQVARYQAGEMDVIDGLPLDRLKSLQKLLPGEYHAQPILANYCYSFNTTKPPFDDLRVRQALCMSLDRETITQKVTCKDDLPGYSFTPPYTDGMSTFLPDWEKWSYDQRIQHAKKLIAEAGYTKKNPLKFTILYNTAENHKRLAVSAVAIWKKHLPVEISLENKEWKTFLDAQRLGNFELIRTAWMADYNEPSTFLNCFLSSSDVNPSFYKNKDFDDCLTKALSAKSSSERAALYLEAESILSKDTPVIPVYFPTVTMLVKPYVGGYPTQNPMHAIYTKDLYILERQEKTK